MYRFSKKQKYQSDFARLVLMKKILLYLACLEFLVSAEKLSANDTIPVNLMSQDIYISKGFSPDWINIIHDNDSWLKIPGGKSGRIRLSIPELKIIGLPRRQWFSFRSYKS